MRVLNFKATNIKKKKKSPTLNFKVNKNQVLNFKIKKRQVIDFKVKRNLSPHHYQSPQKTTDNVMVSSLVKKTAGSSSKECKWWGNSGAKSRPARMSKGPPSLPASRTGTGLSSGKEKGEGEDGGGGGQDLDFVLLSESCHGR